MILVVAATGAALDGEERLRVHRCQQCPRCRGGARPNDRGGEGSISGTEEEWRRLSTSMMVRRHATRRPVGSCGQDPRRTVVGAGWCQGPAGRGPGEAEPDRATSGPIGRGRRLAAKGGGGAWLRGWVGSRALGVSGSGTHEWADMRGIVTLPILAAQVFSAVQWGKPPKVSIFGSPMGEPIKSSLISDGRRLASENRVKFSASQRNIYIFSGYTKNRQKY
jgi:hypothetical protein